MAVSQQHRQRIAELLGREPRGLEDVSVTSSTGQPMVIRVASLVEDKPFPTLFWLVDAALCYRIDTVEAGGLIAQLQQRIDESADYQAQMADDHRRHIALRDSFMASMAAPAGDAWPLFDACAGLPMAVIRGANSDLLSDATVAEMASRHPRLIVANVADRAHVPFLDEPESVAALVAFQRALS